MYVVNGYYKTIGLKSKSKPDVIFTYGDDIYMVCVDDDKESTMNKIKLEIINEFGAFEPERFNIEVDRQIDKEFIIDWQHVGF